jgi:outer membrane lipoprotein SlyB
VRATVDRREGAEVVLRLDDGQELVWPARQLPAGCSDGDVVWLTAAAAAEATAERRTLARDILNEIFDSSDNGQPG